MVIDGARRFTATEGQLLGEQALIETGPSAVLLRVEWPDGSAADFGPATRAMVSPGAVPAGTGPAGSAAAGSARPAAFYLLQSPALRVSTAQGAVLVFESPTEGFLFVESGSATATAGTRGNTAATAVSLASGTVYRRADAGWLLQGRATPAQLQRVLPGLRTSLPLRAARFAGKAVAAPPLPPPAYAELQPWLGAERAVRAGFPRRFAALAQDPAFRKGLQTHLAAHPEWAAVLSPEPTPPPRPPRPPQPAAAASR